MFPVNECLYWKNVENSMNTKVNDNTGTDSPAEGSFGRNLPLLILITTIPLQNIYLAKIPTLGPGLNYLNIMVIASILVWKLRKEFSVPTHTPLNKPIFIFILIYIFSMFYSIGEFGEIPEENKQALKDIIIGILFFYITLNSVRDQKGIIYTLIAMMLPVPYMFRVFNNQLQSVSHFHYDDDMRSISGTFMELGSNEFAAFFAAYSLLFIALLYVKKPRFYQLGLLGITSLSLYCLLYSYSRGSWLSFLLGGLVMITIRSKKMAVAIVLTFLVMGGSLYNFLPISVQERFDSIFVEDEEERDESAASRFVLWEIAFEKFQESPIIGIGFRVFPHVNPYEGKDTHNYFVKILTEQGIIGFSVLLLILIRALRSAKHLYKIAEVPLYRCLGLGGVGILIAFMIGNMFGDRFSHYPLITYFWVSLALVQRALILERERQERSVQAVTD